MVGKALQQALEAAGQSHENSQSGSKERRPLALWSPSLLYHSEFPAYAIVLPIFKVLILSETFPIEIPRDVFCVSFS